MDDWVPANMVQRRRFVEEVGNISKRSDLRRFEAGEVQPHARNRTTGLLL
jgi:hypothetical protein